MPASVEFWFDFSSGYAYFAAQEIDALAARHGRTVLWRPYMLGAAFKVTGATGLSRTPMKGDYARHDWARIARLKKLPLVFHPDHPITQLPATRAYYWIEREQPVQRKRQFQAHYCWHDRHLGGIRTERDHQSVAERQRHQHRVDQHFNGSGPASSANVSVQLEPRYRAGPSNLHQEPDRYSEHGRGQSHRL